MVSITRILCPTDFSECSRRALVYAGAIARACDARVTILHVFAGLPAVELVSAVGAGGLTGSVLTEQDRRDLLAEMRMAGAPAGLDVPTDFVLEESTDPRRAILTQVDARRADLLVMGSHGRSGFNRFVLGSMTERIVRQAPCPVLVVPPHAGHAVPVVPFQRILCAVDFSDSSVRALAYALDLASDAGADVVLLHVMDRAPELELEAERTWTSAQVGDVRAAAEAACSRRLQALVPAEAASYCSIQPRVVEGTAHQEILRAAGDDEVDLIVMGVQGRGAVDLFVFGSHTQEVLRGSRCPVLTVRA